MQYPSSGPFTQTLNGINPNLFPFKVDFKQFFMQYMKEVPFRNLMGKELTRPIVIHKMQAGDGFQYRVPKLNTLDYTNPVTDFNQVSGQAQTQKVDYDYVNCTGMSFPVQVQGEQLLSVGTPVNLPDFVNHQLREACRLNLNKSILDAATTSNYAVATQKPSYDRVILAGVSPTREAYNAYVGINGAIATLATGSGYNQNGLSATVLMNMKIMAAKGGNSQAAVLYNGVTIEDQIRPAYIKTKAGWPMQKYLAFFSPEALIPLLSDPLFSQSTITRGTISDSNQPEIISGADFVGEWNGIYIYIVNDLSQYNVVSGGVTAAWGFLIGAAAWSLGWYREPWIAYKQDQIDMFQLWSSHEIRGQKCLKFAAKQASTVTAGQSTVEQGLIHVFTRIN